MRKKDFRILHKIRKFNSSFLLTNGTLLYLLRTKKFEFKYVDWPATGKAFLL